MWKEMLREGSTSDRVSANYFNAHLYDGLRAKELADDGHFINTLGHLAGGKDYSLAAGRQGFVEGDEGNTGFQGTKSVVLSTTEWVGGKNDFLGVAYVVVGVICLVLAMGFTIKDRCSPRKEGDAAYLRQKGEK